MKNPDLYSDSNASIIKIISLNNIQNTQFYIFIVITFLMIKYNIIYVQKYLLYKLNIISKTLLINNIFIILLKISIII